jgi:NAD(P)-dependent dehydrogenase (short-subunit alcohol dehydrogenase family)
MEPGTGRGRDIAAGGKSIAVEGSLKEVAARIAADGGRAIPIRCDVADPASRAQAADEALAAVGYIDILVNNAATSSYGRKWQDIPAAVSTRLWETNVQGPYDFMQRFGRGMLDRGRGWMINIGSSAAEMPERPFNAFNRTSGVTLYGTTKAALDRMTIGVAAELEGSGVCANAFGPFAVVWTPATKNSGAARYRGLPGWSEEPIEGMAEAALAFATCDPDKVNGIITASTPYLQEIGREIHTLDGKEILRNWKPAID